MSNSTSPQKMPDKIERSVLLTVIGICLLFLTAIITVLFAPNLIDASWTTPASEYQYQMYRVSDPHFYISASPEQPTRPTMVTHIVPGYTLLAWQETESALIVGPQELIKTYVTTLEEPKLKLSTRGLLLRRPQTDEAKAWEKARLEAFTKERPNTASPSVWEIYAPKLDENKKDLFVYRQTDGQEDWVEENFAFVANETLPAYTSAKGLVYVRNPVEFRIKATAESWSVHMQNGECIGEAIPDLKTLTDPKHLAFTSRAELIATGEKLYAEEGCWYCHTDQTRTLPQDSLINASASYPAPPSKANEYSFQKITFPGTRRIGPDLSRVGVKRPERDWHRGHFWSPKSASKGSIMPAFQHFFRNDPRGYAGKTNGVPNEKFEAMFQYLMTKGTRITEPTKAWWKGEHDDTLAIIDGRYKNTPAKSQPDNSGAHH